MMDSYINNFDACKKINIYVFNLGDGGIGDYIKFFMFILASCMKNNERLYCRKNNIEIEKHIKLKYDKMYIDEDNIKQLGCVNFVNPYMYYSSVNYDFDININEVFYFTNEIKINYKLLFPIDITKYVSIHLRLGDKFLETEKQYVACKDDTRLFSEEKIHKFIEANYNKNIFFCCDNTEYKLKIKEKYNNVIIINSDIGHTSLSNTTTKQVLDTITEFYILTNSEMIYGASTSGFSAVASKFNNIPLIQ